MSRPGSIDFFPGFDAPKEREPRAENNCEVCGRRAFFGYRYPGREALRVPCRWRCLAHRIENNEDKD